MIVATPLKSVMTLEPFIGGACFVDIKERKQSTMLQIEYDHDRKRLVLPEAGRQPLLRGMQPATRPEPTPDWCASSGTAAGADRRAGDRDGRFPSA
jgi:hypothetical protein